MNDAEIKIPLGGLAAATELQCDRAMNDAEIEIKLPILMLAELASM